MTTKTANQGGITPPTIDLTSTPPTQAELDAFLAGAKADLEAQPESLWLKLVDLVALIYLLASAVLIILYMFSGDPVLLVIMAIMAATTLLMAMASRRANRASTESARLKSVIHEASPASLETLKALSDQLAIAGQIAAKSENPDTAYAMPPYFLMMAQQGSGRVPTEGEARAITESLSATNKIHELTSALANAQKAFAGASLGVQTP